MKIFAVDAKQVFRPACNNLTPVLYPNDRTKRCLDLIPLPRYRAVIVSAHNLTGISLQLMPNEPFEGLIRHQLRGDVPLRLYPHNHTEESVAVPIQGQRIGGVRATAAEEAD